MSSMSDTNDALASPEAAEDAGDAATGLPWLRSWRGVYSFVFGCFLLWVVLLVVLKALFS
jgi:hypothetical protein